jgi:hypothetical protein
MRFSCLAVCRDVVMPLLVIITYDANRSQVSHIQAVRRQAMGVLDSVVDTALLRALVRVRAFESWVNFDDSSVFAGEHRQCVGIAVFSECGFVGAGRAVAAEAQTLRRTCCSVNSRPNATQSLGSLTPCSYGSHGQHRRALELLGEHGRNDAASSAEPLDFAGSQSLQGTKSTIQYLRRLSAQHDRIILEFRCVPQTSVFCLA